MSDASKGRYRFIVSGSSSLEITKNTEFLTGRKIEFFVTSFSFREFVRARYPEIPDKVFKVEDEEGLSEAEIDFIVDGGDGPIPIEVKLGSAPAREPVVMSNFRATYPRARRGIIVGRRTLPGAEGNKTLLSLPAYLLDFIDFRSFA